MPIAAVAVLVVVAALLTVEAGARRVAGQAPPRVAPGINIDPTNPGGNPTPAQLQAVGATWVR